MATERGLYNKFTVVRNSRIQAGDNTVIADDAVCKHFTFVLCPETDPTALVALINYKLTTRNETLATDLELVVARILASYSEEQKSEFCELFRRALELLVYGVAEVLIELAEGKKDNGQKI